MCVCSFENFFNSFFCYRYFSSCLKIIDIFTDIISPRSFKFGYLHELKMFTILIGIYSTPFLFFNLFILFFFCVCACMWQCVPFYFVHVCISVSSSGVCTRWCAKIVICTKMHLVHADLQTKSFVVVHTWFICTEIPIVNMYVSISVWMQTPSNIIYLILIKFSEVDLKSSRIKLYFFFKRVYLFCDEQRYVTLFISTCERFFMWAFVLLMLLNWRVKLRL